jgi:hypothetical protein
MVFPAAANLRQPPRKTFADKAAASGQRPRGTVVRLDVGLDAMELELVKGMFQNQLQSFAHQSPARVGPECVIADEGALKISANDIVQVDDTHDAAGVPVDDEKSVVRAGLEFFQIFGKRRAGFGLGSDPVAMHRPAPSDGGEKGVAVTGCRRPDEDAAFDAAIQILLFVHLRRDFQAQGVEPDKAGGVVLVVGLGRVGFPRGTVRVVKAHGNAMFSTSKE